MWPSASKCKLLKARTLAALAHRVRLVLVTVKVIVETACAKPSWLSIVRLNCPSPSTFPDEKPENAASVTMASEN